MPEPDDFGRVRVYRCPCGRRSVRPLRRPPRPCPCGAALGAAPFSVDDHRRLAAELLAEEPDDAGT